MAHSFEFSGRGRGGMGGPRFGTPFQDPRIDISVGDVGADSSEDDDTNDVPDSGNPRGHCRFGVRGRGGWGRGRGGLGHFGHHGGPHFGHHGGPHFGHHGGPHFGHHGGPHFGHHGGLHGGHPHGGHHDSHLGHGRRHHPYMDPRTGMNFPGADEYMEKLARRLARQEKNSRPGCPTDEDNKAAKRNNIDPVDTLVEVKDGKFTVTIVLEDNSKPEDLKLKVKDGQLIVEIKMEKTSEDGSSELSQIFRKKIELPEQVRVEELTSNLSPEGILKIEAPVPIPQDITVPVNVEDPPSAPPQEN